VGAGVFIMLSTKLVHGLISGPNFLTSGIMPIGVVNIVKIRYSLIFYRRLMFFEGFPKVFKV